jgi:hypothetical protein
VTESFENMNCEKRRKIDNRLHLKKRSAGETTEREMSTSWRDYFALGSGKAVVEIESGFSS